MLVEQALEDLELLAQSDELFVEIDGVVHPISAIVYDSQGVYLQVDTLEEDKEMR